MKDPCRIIKIVIVDDHPIVRQGIKKIIEIEQDLKVIGEARGANDALTLLGELNPDIAIVDISLEGEVNGIDLVKAVRDRYSDIYALVLSMYDESIYAERAIRAGARGYVTKKEAPSNIVDAIRVVDNGELYLNNLISGRIINKLIHGSPVVVESPIDTLSDREFEVYQLIGNGFGTGEIAKKLNLSVNTIESHRKKIKDKLRIKSGSELVKNAVQWVISQN